MIKEDVLYRERQVFYWFLVPILISKIFLIYSFFYELGSKPIPLEAFVGLLLLIVLVLLLFYDLKIEITKTNFKICFGIGLIKKQISIAEIDRSTISKVAFPWYYGMGIRFTPKGFLFNTKVGDALLFKSINRKRVFIVGTDNFEKIKTVLMKNSNL